MIYRLLVACAICCGLFSCASTYKPIVPQTLTYASSGASDSMFYGYRYDVLALVKNKKYAKKEVKKGVKVVAVKIENKTSKAIVFRNDVQVIAGNKLVYPMESKLILQELKQPAALYLLWGLLWLNINNDCDDDGDCSSTPIPIGLGIAAINVGVASGANNKFLSELKVNNMIDKTINPGETVYGLIGLPIESPDALEFKFKQ